MKNEKVKEREKQMGVKEAKEPFMEEEIIYVGNFSFLFFFSCLILAVTLLQREKERVLRFWCEYD